MWLNPSGGGILHRQGGRACFTWLAPCLALALFLGGLPGCASRQDTQLPPPRKYSGPGPGETPPPAPGKSGKVPGTQRPYTIQGKTYRPLPSAEGYHERGIASWYGPNFHGKRTSNGEQYNMESLTAAHKTLPMDTWVEVTNQENGRQLVLRINDRGPFVDGRIIDLSKAAARDLGVLGKGTALVEVKALGYRQMGTGVAGKPAVYVPPPSYDTGTFTVQVGAFTNTANAQRLAAKLRPQWGTVSVVRYDRGDAVFHRVWVGKVSRLEEAKALQERLRAAGQDKAFAVAW
ncbi:MAG: septal ring lytic transglycosylase RlpA family protein [Desulfarculus sp.]|nr:septal ring lytic transglycosylase RlpA family protein [Desulfarculus sp.]